ncbi:MAG TPA: lactate racemase domain-containing protein, partial [Frankiaceae bacterium]|nr:lactate racemase domain-containing protein [Frankiaceae bacterium]
MPSATIRWGAWFEDCEIQLDFPAEYEVLRCPPADGPDIGAAGIAAAFAAPVGARRLSELARARHRPVIVIDDLSRPTPGRRLLPPILDELEAAGIPARDVLILAGVANHRPMQRADFLKKIGPDVLRRCRVSNHFSWDGCTLIGTTSFGSPVEVNNEFLACDLRILVGSIIPHAAAGFAGGAKLLMPGIASIRSAEAYHRGSALRGGYGLEAPDARLESEEAARMAGVDFIVNAIPNSRLGLAGLVTGDVVEAHRAGTAIARQVFATPTPPESDICVLSLYPKDSEFLQHLTAFAPHVTAETHIVREGGTFVVVVSGEEGLGSHSLFGPGRRLAAPRPTRIRGRDVIFF